MHNEIWYHSFQLSRFFDVCLVKYMIHLCWELTNFKGWLGKISRNIMSKFSSSHPLCRSCLFSSTFMSGDQLPRVGQGICGFGAAAVSRHCAPVRSIFWGRWKTFLGTLRSILRLCAQSHWWKCALDCLEAQCTASRMEGLGVDKKLVWWQWQRPKRLEYCRWK